MFKKVKVFIFIFSLIVFSVGANFVLAQADFGTEPVAEVINLSQADPRAVQEPDVAAGASKLLRVLVQ